jgi:hypothetical protein
MMGVELKNKRATGIVAVFFGLAMWLIVWPTFAPFITFSLPLRGTNEVTSLRVQRDSSGRWIATVGYFFKGRPDGSYLIITLSPESDDPPPKDFNLPQQSKVAVRGAHTASIEVQRPAVDHALTTKRITVKLIAGARREELASKSVDVAISWPDSKTWQIDKEVASKPPEEILKKAVALIDAGDTRSLVQAKLIVGRLMNKDPRFAPGIEQMVRIAAKASWGPQGYVRLDTTPKIREEVNALENEQAYGELEQLAISLRESKAVTQSGQSMRNLFQRAVNGDLHVLPEMSAKELASLESEQGLELIKTNPFVGGWLRRSPDAIVPQIYIANQFYRAAWQIRGGGYAITVSEANGKRAKALFEKAKLVLYSCKNRCDVDPEWYVAVLSVLMSSSSNRNELVHTFSEGFRKFPDYTPIHDQMAFSLSPRWGGSTEQVESFVNKLASNFTPELGDEMYAHMYRNLFRKGVIDTKKVSEIKANCVRLMRGERNIVSRFPTNYNYNFSAFMASRCGDRSATRKLMSQIGNEVDPMVWTSEEFANASAWSQ